jgi:hypothetical protein
MLWLLASEQMDGRIEMDFDALAFRLRISTDDLKSALTPLIEKGFINDASNVLASCKQLATPETETETETEKAKAARNLPISATTAGEMIEPPDCDSGAFEDLPLPTLPTPSRKSNTDAQGQPDGHSGGSRCPYQKIVDLYHAKLPMLPAVEKLTKTRMGHLRQRWAEDLPDLESWGRYFDDVALSPFLTGRIPGSNGRPPFRATLEWLTIPGNFAKVAERTYHR